MSRTLSWHYVLLQKINRAVAGGPGNITVY